MKGIRGVHYFIAVCSIWSSLYQQSSISSSILISREKGCAWGWEVYGPLCVGLWWWAWWEMAWGRGNQWGRRLGREGAIGMGGWERQWKFILLNIYRLLQVVLGGNTFEENIDCLLLINRWDYYRESRKKLDYLWLFLSLYIRKGGCI